MYLASIILIAIYTFITWRSVKTGLFVLLASLPLYLVKLEVLSIPTTLLEVMFGVLLVFAITNYLRTITPSTPFKVGVWGDCADIPAFLATAILILGAVLGLAQTSDLASSLNAIKSFLVEPILLAIIILTTFNHGDVKAHLRSLMFALAIPTALVSVYAIVQHLTGFGIPDAWFLERRVTSIFPYPNALGHFVAPIVALNVVWLMQRGLKRLGAFEIMLTITTLLGLVAVFLSQTEASWVALAVTIVLAGVYLGRHRKTWLTIAVLGAILVVAIPQARHKLALQDWSGQTRLAQWEETWNFLSSSPRAFILGAGANRYPVAVAPFHTHDYLEIFQQPHNIFLNVWVEYGLLGLLGFLALTVALAMRKKPALALPLVAGLVEMSIHGLVDVPYFKNDLSILTWALIAFFILATRDIDERREA